MVAPLPGRLSRRVLERVLADGDEVWERFRRRADRGYHTLVPADYPAVWDALVRLHGRATSFLELGSGVGVITVLADLLGFEAYGIEIEGWLVDQAVALAERHDSGAVFVHGSYVPEEYRDEVHLSDPDFLTVAEGVPAYADLGMDLSDFDLVYAFPWPGELERHLDLMRRCGRRDAFFLTYESPEGVRLFRGGAQVPL